VEKEEFGANSAQLDKAKLCVAPKALDAVDVVLAPGKFVFVVMNAMVFVATQKQAIIAKPPIGVDGCFGEHLAFDNRLAAQLWSSF